MFSNSLTLTTNSYPLLHHLLNYIFIYTYTNLKPQIKYYYFYIYIYG